MRAGLQLVNSTRGFKLLDLKMIFTIFASCEGYFSSKEKKKKDQKRGKSRIKKITVTDEVNLLNYTDVLTKLGYA